MDEIIFYKGTYSTIEEGTLKYEKEKFPIFF